MIVWRTHTSSTYSRGCHSDEDVVVGELIRLGGAALFDDAALLALEDRKSNHGERGDSNDAVNLNDRGRNGLKIRMVMERCDRWKRRWVYGGKHFPRSTCCVTLPE